MHDIFITTLDAPLPGWEAAFAEPRLHPELSPELLRRLDAAAAVVWLHQTHAGQNVAGVIEAALKQQPALKLVVLSNAPEQQQAFHAMAAGASGYCHAYSPAGLLGEVRAVITRGGLWLGRDLLQRLIHVSAGLVSSRPERVGDALAKLTPREREVALAAAEGMSNKEIARRLDITERTVKAHISSCLERLAVRDRLQLALALNDSSGRPING